MDQEKIKDNEDAFGLKGESYDNSTTQHRARRIRNKRKKYVKIVLQTLQKSQLTHETNAMATIIEAKTVQELFSVIQKAHQAVADAGALRIITEIKIDDRRDKEAAIQSKLNSLQ